MSNKHNNAQAVPSGWVFKRNQDGSIGVFAPSPKPGESPRTSAVIYPSLSRDLHELLGKLADHQTTPPATEQAVLTEVADCGVVTKIIKPFTPTQRKRLWDNSKEHHKDAASFTGFERIVTLTERAHQIGVTSFAQPATDAGVVEDVYAQGWIAAAGWAMRPDLIADMDSPAYTNERDGRLMARGYAARAKGQP